MYLFFSNKHSVQAIAKVEHEHLVGLDVSHVNSVHEQKCINSKYLQSKRCDVKKKKAELLMVCNRLNIIREQKKVLGREKKEVRE